MSPAFRVPTRVTLEPGCRRQVGEVAAALGARRALLVADPGLAATPWPAEVLDLLARSGLDPALDDGVEANPRAATVERLAERLASERRDVVVGLGGGSVLDAAKAAAMLAPNGGAIAGYVGLGRYRRAPLPVIAMPTTCGTGSEVTWVAVVSVPEEGSKISVKGEEMFPRAALVDPDLLATLPAPLVATTGLDALTHAVEATTGRQANPLSDALAEQAVALVFRYLERAVAAIADDAEARCGMATAATVAGVAFGNADVGPVHCLSEALGGRYDVPHGLANGLLLAPMLRAHGTSVGARLEALAASLPPGAGQGTGGERILSAIERLVASLDLPPFSSFAVPARDYPEIARLAVANGSNPSSPRPMGEQEYLEVLAAMA